MERPIQSELVWGTHAVKQTVSLKVFYVKKEIYFTTGSICTKFKLPKGDTMLVSEASSF